MLQSMYVLTLFSPVIIEKEKALRQLGMQCVDHAKRVRSPRRPQSSTNLKYWDFSIRSYIYLCIVRSIWSKIGYPYKSRHIEKREWYYRVDSLWLTPFHLHLKLIFPLLFLSSGYIPSKTITMLWWTKLLFNIVSVDVSFVFDLSFSPGPKTSLSTWLNPPAAYVYCVATKLRPPPLLSPSKLVFSNNSSDDEA